MTLSLIVVGKTDSGAVSGIVENYAKRIGRYARFEIVVIPDPKNTKNLGEQEQKKVEGEQILRNISEGDFVVLLDERGDEMSSEAFAGWLERRLAGPGKKLCFVIGGPYGFSDAVYARAGMRLSLSRMTFSHQIVRAIFAEQLYRAFTILRGEPYHHK